MEEGLPELRVKFSGLVSPTDLISLLEGVLDPGHKSTLNKVTC